MSRKKFNYAKLEYEPRAYYVLCSFDTKNEIDKFFMENMKFKKTLTPIIINGVRVFSVCQYRKDLTYANMLQITKYGAELVADICGRYEDSSKMESVLYRYLTKYIEDQGILDMIKNIIPYIVYHFNTSKDQKCSPYRYGNMNQKYLCFFYPIFKDEEKGLDAIVTNIKIRKESDIQKGLLYYN